MQPVIAMFYVFLLMTFAVCFQIFSEVNPIGSDAVKIQGVPIGSTAPLTGQCLKATSPSLWEPSSCGGSGTVTSVALTVPSWLSVAGSPITSAGTLMITGAPSFSDVLGTLNLATQASGNLAVSHLNSGTAASASTFWRGDGTWAAAGGSGCLADGTVLSGTYAGPVCVNGNASLGANVVVPADLNVNGTLTNTGGYILTVHGNMNTQGNISFTPASQFPDRTTVLIVDGDLFVGSGTTSTVSSGSVGFIDSNASQDSNHTNLHYTSSNIDALASAGASTGDVVTFIGGSNDGFTSPVASIGGGVIVLQNPAPNSISNGDEFNIFPGTNNTVIIDPNSGNNTAGVQTIFQFTSGANNGFSTTLSSVNSSIPAFILQTTPPNPVVLGDTFTVTQPQSVGSDMNLTQTQFGQVSVTIGGNFYLTGGLSATNFSSGISWKVNGDMFLYPFPDLSGYLAPPDLLVNIGADPTAQDSHIATIGGIMNVLGTAWGLVLQSNGSWGGRGGDVTLGSLRSISSLNSSVSFSVQANGGNRSGNGGRGGGGGFVTVNGDVVGDLSSPGDNFVQAIGGNGGAGPASRGGSGGLISFRGPVLLGKATSDGGNVQVSFPTSGTAGYCGTVTFQSGGNIQEVELLDGFPGPPTGPAGGIRFAGDLNISSWNVANRPSQVSITSFGYPASLRLQSFTGLNKLGGANACPLTGALANIGNSVFVNDNSGACPIWYQIQGVAF